MPVCEKIRAVKKQTCIGDMRNRISLYRRDLTAPLSRGTNHTEEFTLIDQVWAQVKSTSGVEYPFDDTNTFVEATHEWSMRYRDDIDANVWIQYRGVWHKILDVNNDSLLNLTLIIKTTIRGPTGKPVNEA